MFTTVFDLWTKSSISFFSVYIYTFKRNIFFLEGNSFFISPFLSRHKTSIKINKTSFQIMTICVVTSYLHHPHNRRDQPLFLSLTSGHTSYSKFDDIATDGMVRGKINEQSRHTWKVEYFERLKSL